MQRAGNPWGLAGADRLAWAEGLDVPRLQEGVEVEYLYWVGCSASYDRRNQAIARAVVKVLKAAGVSFAVMAEEKCTGDAARRLGEEYLYQTLARENVENLNRYRFRKVIAPCPHCFNTIGREYRQFGGQYEVCTTRGHRRASPRGAAPAHPPPRRGPDLSRLLLPGALQRGLRRAPGVAEGHPWAPDGGDAPEPEQGAVLRRRGGPHVDGDPRERRVNEIRVEEALATRATTVGTACPFCLAMVDLGRKVAGAEEKIAVKDIAELVAEALP